MLRLQLRHRPHQFVKLSFATVTLGRDEGNDLVIDAPTVSDFHAEISCEEHRHYIVDLLSANGTFVNGRPISGRCELKSWDLVRLGKVELEVADPNTCRPGDWALRPRSEQLASQFYALKPATVVGRDPGCDIAIDNSMLSRRHAQIFIQGERLRILDLNSANGTFLNGRRITEASARPGDELRFDVEAFIIEGPSDGAARREAVNDDHTVVRNTAQPPEAAGSAAILSADKHRPGAPATRSAASRGADVKPGIDKEPFVAVKKADSNTDRTQFISPDSDVDRTRFISPHADADATRFMPSHSDTDSTRFMSSDSDVDATQFMPPDTDADATRFMPSESDVGATRFMPSDSDADASRFMSPDSDTGETRFFSPDPAAQSANASRLFDDNPTRPLLAQKPARQRHHPPWLYGGLLLAAALIAAALLYLWRSGLL